jgi:hypothetical protein
MDSISNKIWIYSVFSIFDLFSIYLFVNFSTDHGQVTGKFYHLRTHAVLVIGLFELLGNPTT